MLNPRIFQVRLPQGLTEGDAVELYTQREFVQLADRNWIVDASLSATFPNDPDFSEQWHLHNNNDVDIDAPEVWDIETGSSDVVIAVVDTGIDLEHDDLAGNLWVNPDTSGDSLFFNDSISYPGTWNWDGEDTMTFIYYGANNESGTHELLVREIVSVR